MYNDQRKARLSGLASGADLIKDSAFNLHAVTADKVLGKIEDI